MDINAIKESMKKIEINPYRYLTDLSEERSDDVIVKNIKYFCMNVIQNPSVAFEYSREDVLDILEFILMKHEEVTELQEKLQMPDIEDPFTQIGHSLDLITVQDDIQGKMDMRSVYYSLSSQLTNARDLLDFCTVTLNSVLDLYTEGNTDESSD